MKFNIVLTQKRVKGTLLAAIFLLFVLNVIGVTSFHYDIAPQLDVHGNLALTLLRGGILGALLQLDFFVFLTAGIALTVALPALAPIAASLVTLLAAIPPFYVAYTSPLMVPIVPLEYALLTTLMMFSVNVLCSYFVETHAKQQIIDAFSQYVPPELVREISRHPEAFSMDGETREMSVLFCDIVHFSAIAEQLEARVLAAMLNRYLTEMTDVLHRHGATIDKYSGDAIMAFWGAPIQQRDHAVRAVHAALDMQQGMDHVRAEFGARNWPTLQIGIGVNSSTMHVGNMGSIYRVAYTVLGDAVNLAARLEALTRLYELGILISETTKAACDDVAYREIDHVRVKGKGHSTRLFEPLADGSVSAVDLARHAAALTAYYDGHWQTAADGFARMRQDGLSPAYCRTIIERMAASSNDAPEGWDGIVRFGSDLAYSVGAHDRRATDSLPNDRSGAD